MVRTEILDEKNQITLEILVSKDLDVEDNFDLDITEEGILNL